MVRSVIKEWEWKITNIRTETVFINIFRDRYSPGSVGDAASVCGLQSRGLCRIRAHAGSRGAPLWCQRRSRGTPGSAEGLVAVLNPDFTLSLTLVKNYIYCIGSVCLDELSSLHVSSLVQFAPSPVPLQHTSPAWLGFFLLFVCFLRGKKKSPNILIKLIKCTNTIGFHTE